MAQVVKVNLGDRSYDIQIAGQLLDRIGAFCEPLKLGKTCLVVSDSHVDPLYGDRVERSLSAAGFATGRVAVPAGETSKSQQQLLKLYDKAVESGLDRKSFIVALGGGVVGDLAGYLAATFLRGIPFVQVPTSLLAMVDSSVGGKTGINLPQGKNLVGAFHQPALVLADTSTLKTLPRREFISGLAEVVKYGVIRDAEFFATLEAHQRELLNGEPEFLESVVARCCEIKADVVRLDERESGLRAILNFGHTIGHAIEQVTGYGKFLHGEAISIGMLYAARLSMKLKGFPRPECDRLFSLLKGLELPVDMPDCEWSDIWNAMGVDKKGTGRIPRFVLCEAIGKVVIDCEAPASLLEEIWHIGHK